jgi:glycerophosphoryl diester phosphodiesterase
MHCLLPLLGKIPAMTLSKDWLQRFNWPLSLADVQPLAIAHRGASAHAPENSLSAFRVAADLSSELWELDVHLSSDGVCVVSHDDDLMRMTGQHVHIAQATWSEISKLKMPEEERIPRLEEVIALAKQTGCGLYIELKAEGAGRAVWRLLLESNFRFASLGSFNVKWVEELRHAGCDYPLSVLVPLGVDPLEYVGDLRVEIVHLCWENASDTPAELITDELLYQFQENENQIVIWHEERAGVLAQLLNKPVMGICSNNPEMLKPYRQKSEHSIAIVCHRGANALAPENTLEAARLCINQGFQFVEIDVRTSADGEVVVMHDATLDRTTNGVGPINTWSAADIAALDAGSWFSDRTKGVGVPTLSQILELARGRIGVYVEIKQASPDVVLDIVTEHKMLPHCFFWSPDRDALRWLRSQSPEIVLMAPRWMYGSVEEAVADYNAQIIEFDATKDDLSEVSLCNSFCVRSMIFSLSHERTDLQRYLRYNPDMINLDSPIKFKILASYPDVQKHFDLITS